MNILIMGAKGQLGREMTDCFARGYSALGTPDILKESNVLCLADIDEVDVGDLDALRLFLENQEIDVIFNCAAYTNVDGCETNTETAFRANALGARNLAIVAREKGAKLVHVSTDYVFAGDGDRPYAEWDLPAPISAYGKSKLLGEQYIREQTERYFIVRTSWLYGKYGKNFVKTILRVAKERGACRVVADQRGNPTNAADLAHHLLKLATTEEYGVYHGTGNGECSWFDFAARIVSLAGIDATVSPCTTAEYPTPTKRPAYSALDHLALRATVGDEFRHWEDALAAFFAENGTELD
ncbi:MAG: dTDP-4-dehydrorhamnose reductase [Clostridia bacterium]|nr:dTDP-4-dehydrorhamnose reductase [Clostridia bacterium]